MKPVLFIGCSKGKLAGRPRMAKTLYTGTLFKASLLFARRAGTECYVLSAKYGIVGLEDEIQAYNTTLKEFDKKQAKDWSDMVMGQLIQRNLLKREFHSICGKPYEVPLILAGIPLTTYLNGITNGLRVKHLNGASSLGDLPHPITYVELVKANRTHYRDKETREDRVQRVTKAGSPRWFVLWYGIFIGLSPSVTSRNYHQAKRKK